MIPLGAFGGFLGICALAIAQPPATPLPSFEAASVKLRPQNDAGMSISPYGTNRFTMTNTTLPPVIQLAFDDIPDTQILGQPNWMDAERYDVIAKAEDGVILTRERLRPRLQRLLAERFKLATHWNTKEAQGYALLVAKGGPRLKPAAPETEGRGMVYFGQLFSASASLETLAGLLSLAIHRPVINKTSIEGNYEIDLHYARDDDTNPSLPSIFTVLQEQLGLKLETQKISLKILVIDHVERVPTEN